MKEYKVRDFGLPSALTQAAYLYEKLAVVARENYAMPLSIAAGMVAEMRRKIGAEWWGQSAPQRAHCPYYAVEDLASVEDLLTAAGTTDAAVVAALQSSESLKAIRRGIERSAAWVKAVAAVQRTGERFCAACGEAVEYDECPCGAKAIFRTGDFCGRP